MLTLAFISTLLLESVSADEKVDEKISRFVETYIKTFNKRQPLKSFFHFPNVWLVEDSVEPEILTDSSVPIVNYENLVKTELSPRSNSRQTEILNLSPLLKYERDRIIYRIRNPEPPSPSGN
tara:strand:+ start:449 stop:814 length:366 start_codon:yes stop_codon:yes gene_type:complete